MLDVIRDLECAYLFWTLMRGSALIRDAVWRAITPGLRFTRWCSNGMWRCGLVRVIQCQLVFMTVWVPSYLGPFFSLAALALNEAQTLPFDRMDCVWDSSG